MVPLSATVAQYYTAWPTGWDATVAPALTVTVTLTGSDPGELVLDSAGLTVTVTRPTSTSLTVTGPSADVATALASRLSLEAPTAAGSVTVGIDVEHNLPARVAQDPTSNRIYRVWPIGSSHPPEVRLDEQNWLTVRPAATATSLWGLSGYLASVTSAAENEFIADLVRPGTAGTTVYYWLGGTDAATEGEWRWVDGPESVTSPILWAAADQARSQRGTVQVGSDSRFTWWADGEPNDFALTLGEDRLRLNVTSTGQLWNDVDKTPTNVSDGAIVEYGGVPQTNDPRRESTSVVVTVRSRFDHLIDYADANGTSQAFPTAPDAAEWTQTGVTGVTTADRTASLLSVLARPGVTGSAVGTTADVQAIVDAYAAVLAHATSGTAPAPTAAQWGALGITGLDADGIARLNSAVVVAGPAGVDRAEELVALADIAATTTTTTTSSTTTTTPSTATTTPVTTAVPPATESVTTTSPPPTTTSPTSSTPSTTTIRSTTTTTTAPVEVVIAPTANGRPTGQPVVVLDDGSTVAQAPMTGSVIVDSRPTPITVRPTTQGTVVAEGAGMRLSLGAVDPDGSPLPLSDDRLSVPHGGTVTVGADGFAPGSTVDVWAFSTPVFLGTGIADASGAVDLAVEVPDVLAAGSHTLQFTGESATSEPVAVSIGLIVTEPAPVTEPVTSAPTSEESNTPDAVPVDGGSDGATAARDGDTTATSSQEKAPPFAPVAALDDPAGLVTTATAGVAALAAASAAGASAAAAAARGAGGGSTRSGGGSRSGGSSAGGSSRGGEQTEERAELRSVDVAGIAVAFAGTAAGDGSCLWRWPGTGLVDRWSAATTVALAARAPLVSRLIADGSALRAMFGSVSALLPAGGVALGVAAAIDTGGIAMPPTVGLMLAIIVLGVIDALAGALAFAVYAVGVVVAGGILDLDSVRALMGIAVLCFAPTLIAAAFRPIRRTPAANGDEAWERAVDLVVVPLLAGMTAQAMVWALNGVAGVDFPFGYEADRVAVIVMVTMLAKVLLEECAGRWFPERMLIVCPPDLPEPSALRSSVTVVSKVAVYVFVVVTILGNVWHLWAVAAMFAAPLALGLVADRLPNVPMLWRVVPLGVPSMVMYFLVGIYASVWIESWLGETADYARLSFVAISAPFALIGVLYLFGREGDEGEERWCYRPRWRWVYRLGGVAMTLYAVALHMGWV
jgi:hypothetical protein